MKLLLDEQIDYRYKDLLSDFGAYTLSDMGWVGFKNGILREKTNENKFDFFLTADKNLPFQQNLNHTSFRIILLDTPTLLWEHQKLFIPKIINFLNNFDENMLPKIIHVSVEGFSKGKKREQYENNFSSEQIFFI